MLLCLCRNKLYQLDIKKCPAVTRNQSVTVTVSVNHAWCHTDNVVYYWIPPLVDSISFRSRSFSLVLAHEGIFSYASWLLAAGAQKHMSRCHLRATFADGRERSCEYLLRAIRRRQRPGAVKYCAQPSVSSQWSKQTNPSDKQLGGLTFFSLAKVVFASAPGSLLLKSLLICHMALENSITTKNGDNHVALCGLAASLKIFM